MSDSAASSKRRVGIVGYGKLGEYLVKAIEEVGDQLEVAFIWNRSPDKVKDAGYGDVLLEDLNDVASKSPDLIIEVAHPAITAEYGVKFIQTCDYMVGSPTCFADANVEATMRQAVLDSQHGLYIPSGALWGASDLAKMGRNRSLKGLKVTMKKHPGSLKLSGELFDKNEAAKDATGEVILYEGSVRGLCPLAPNNVNTMAAAAMTAPDLGFDGVIGCLVADTRLDAHVIEINAVGPGDPPFKIDTVRFNPSKPGAVTGNATYASFKSSMLKAKYQGQGVHFC